MNRLLIACLLLGLIMVACGESGTQEQTAEATETDTDTTQTPMAQFADDAAFVAAHPNPEGLDFEPKGSMVEFPAAEGETASAYVVEADANPDNKYVFMIHEWWGLNDYIKQEAERLAASMENTTVMALDLYDGKVADTQEKAGEYMQAVQPARAEAIIKGALAKIGPDAKIGTIGWCFGGGWSLRTSILAGEQAEACVMYYGMPVDSEEAISPLDAPVLGIFASEDGWINEEVISNFEQLAETADKELTVKVFEGAHAFANPSNPDYDPQATREAHTLALNFLRERL